VGGRELVRALGPLARAGRVLVSPRAQRLGKTSLILALAGLRAPQSGAIALDGVSSARTGARARPAHRRAAPGREPDFGGSVLDYVMLGRYPALEERLEPGRGRRGGRAPLSSTGRSVSHAFRRRAASGPASRRSSCRTRTSCCSDEPLAASTHHQATGDANALPVRVRRKNGCSLRSTSPDTRPGTAALRFYWYDAAARAWGAQGDMLTKPTSKRCTSAAGSGRTGSFLPS